MWVYGPMLAGTALLVAGAIGVGAAGFGSVGVWADVSLISLVLLGMVLLLLGGMVLGLLVYGVARLSGWLPPVFSRVREIFGRAGDAVERGADLSVRPVLWLGGIGALACLARTRLASLWRRAGEGRDGGRR